MTITTILKKEAKSFATVVSGTRGNGLPGMLRWPTARTVGLRLGRTPRGDRGGAERRPQAQVSASPHEAGFRPACAHPAPPGSTPPGAAGNAPLAPLPRRSNKTAYSRHSPSAAFSRNPSSVFQPFQPQRISDEAPRPPVFVAFWGCSQCPWGCARGEPAPRFPPLFLRQTRWRFLQG